MKIETAIVIIKPAAAVWAIVGDQFGDAHLWGSALTHTHGHGGPIHGQVCESRTCDIKGMGRIREKLLEFDSKNYALTYEVVEGFPFFVERGVNRWTLEPDGTTTHVRSNAEIVTKGIFGTIMEPMMKIQMTRLMRTLLDDLKHYAETGTPHPRKAKAIAAKNLIRA